MLYEYITRNKKLLIFMLTVGLLGFSISIYLLANRSSGIPIDVYIIPQDAIATVDGKTLRTGKQRLPAGTHEVIVRKYGFTDYHQEIKVDDTHTSIDVALLPISAEATKWSEYNANLYLEKEARASKVVNATGKQFSKDNPIVNQLPIDNLIYSIGYKRASSDPNDNKIIIEIDAMKGYRNGAVKKIRDLGYNPADFIINFRDYRNPFEL